MAEPTDHPHFFQIIVKSEQLRQLSIPKKFVLGHRDLFSIGRFCLRVAGTRIVSWKVEVVKMEDGHVRLGRGWQEFCRLFSLTFGNFLMFRYSGDNIFDVVIFDTSATEIDYRSYLDKRGTETSADDSFEGSNAQDDERDMEWTDGDEEKTDEDDNKKDGESIHVLGDEKLHTRWSEPRSEEGVTRRDKTATTDKSANIKSTAVKNNRAPDLGTKATFKIRMLPTYISNKCTVHVPTKHAKLYLVNDGIKDGIITLTLESSSISLAATMTGHRAWYVNYRTDNTNIYVKLSQGWYEFVVDNSIREDDVCIFELIDVQSKMYKVSIVRQGKLDGTEKVKRE